MKMVLQTASKFISNYFGAENKEKGAVGKSSVKRTLGWSSQDGVLFGREQANETD